jgi:two-component system sensor histidine kinase PilS (NtrC family)
MPSISQPIAQEPLSRRVKRLMLGRVVVVTFLWATLVGVELTESPTTARLPLTYIIFITYGCTILYALFLRYQPNLERLYLWQVWVDLAIETAIVQSTGGLDSGFIFLYILSIISAGIALPGRRIFGVAAGASGLYILFVALDFKQIFHPLPFPFAFRIEMSLSASYVFYSTLLTITAFWVVALLSRYLADSLRQTGQVLQEQAAHLNGLQAFHKNVVNSMYSGVLITDMTGRLVSSNNAAERILQLPLGSQHGWFAQEVFPGVDIEDVFRIVERLDYGLNRGEVLFERNDGQKIIIGISYSPLRDEHGTVHGLIINFQDITSVRTMEVEMRRAEQLAAVGRLAAAIAHEIRNPLASISGSIQLMRSELVLDDSNQRLMDIVSREIGCLNTMITDFLGYARPRPLEYVPVDIHKLIAGTLALLRNGLPEGSTVKMLTQFSPDVSEVIIDPQGIRQVIWNLCLNAVEAMRNQGSLTVRTIVEQLSHREHWSNGTPQPTIRTLIIEVIDSGPGLSPEVKEKIFEPFYSTKENGTGLGLATVDRIVACHKGKIEVETQPGQGTTIRVHLPLIPLPRIFNQSPEQ